MRRQTDCVTRLLALVGLVGVAVAVLAPCPVLAEPPAAEPPAQPPGGVAVPADMPQKKLDDEVEPAPAVKRLLEAPYLSDEERRGVRIFHGVWTPTDVDGPLALAKVSLIAGIFDDEIFAFDGADPLDRAEAAMLRGDAELALTLTDGRTEPRGLRIRAEALLSVGKADEALKTTEPLLAAITSGKLTSAEDIVEGVRALMLRARLAGANAGEFQAMNGVLAQVRDRIDRLYWPAQLAEARLLADKDNMAHADKAAQAVLTLNPRSAETWALRGQFASRAFDLKAADAIASRLDDIAFPATSAYAGLVRARTAMRMRDAAGALKALEPLLKAYPKHREALALRAAALAVASDMVGAEDAVKAYETLAPGSPDAVLEVGRALSEARQYEEAAAYLRRAVERAPNWSVPVMELGLVLNQAGQDQDARDALSDAVRLDPFNVRAGNTLNMLENLLTYSKIESEHFVVHYRVDKPGEPPQANQIMAREMLPVLEKIHTTVAGNGPGGIDHQPAARTQIDLMPDHATFAVRIAGMPQIHTIAAATGPVIAMEVPRDGAGHQGPYAWARVVQHEYTHTVTLSRTKNRIPHWFTEAAAVYLEKAPRDYSAIQLLSEAFASDQLFDFEKINLAFIRPEKPTDRAQAYAQGHWMYEFLATRWGDKAPLALMDLYAQGKTEAQAFPIAIKMTREEFFDEFKAWAADKLVEWGMAPASGEPSVRELLSAAARHDPDAEGAEGGAGGEGDEPAVENPDDTKAITPELVAKWLEDHPTHPDLLELAVQQALKAARNKPTPDMIPLLERYSAARPVDPMPHKLLARLLLDGAGDGPDGAIPHLEYLDAREQYTPAYAAELARRYSARAAAGGPATDWDRAQASATRATQIAPFDADHRELAATIAIRRKDFVTARQHLQALVELEPDRAIHKQRLEALEKLSAGK